jgi:hypothetical protein
MAQPNLGHTGAARNRPACGAAAGRPLSALLQAARWSPGAANSPVS